jgi:hypothetical protein
MQIQTHYAGVKMQSTLRSSAERPDSSFDQVIALMAPLAVRQKSGVQSTDANTETPGSVESDVEAPLLSDPARQEDPCVAVASSADQSPGALSPLPTFVDGVVAKAGDLLVETTSEQMPRFARENESTMASMPSQQSDRVAATAQMVGVNAPLLAEASGEDTTGAGPAELQDAAKNNFHSHFNSPVSPPQVHAAPSSPGHLIQPGPQGAIGPDSASQQPNHAANTQSNSIHSDIKTDVNTQLFTAKSLTSATGIGTLFRHAELERYGRSNGSASLDSLLPDRGSVAAGPIVAASSTLTQTAVSAVSAPHHPLPVHQVAQAITTAWLHGSTGQIDIVLRPRELGQIRFEMIANGEKIHVIVSAERTESMDLIRRNVDQLMADLRQSGFHQATLGFGGWAAQDQSGKPGQETGSDATADALSSDAAPIMSILSQRLTAEGRLDLRL